MQGEIQSGLLRSAELKPLCDGRLKTGEVSSDIVDSRLKARELIGAGFIRQHCRDDAVSGVRRDNRNACDDRSSGVLSGSTHGCIHGLRERVRRQNQT